MSNQNNKNEFFDKAEMNVQINVSSEMRDGTILYSDIYSPAEKGQYPVLLSRIPYGKNKPRYHSLYMDPLRAIQRGYVVVIQDVRGKHTSDGEFDPFFNELSDGYDTLEWITNQEWCDGNIGMFGISYHGATQWLAAASEHPSLKTIIPGVTSDSYFDSWTYLGGVLQFYWMTHWTVGGLVLDDIKRKSQNLNERKELAKWNLDNTDSESLTSPLNSLPPFKEIGNFYNDWIDHDSYDDYWKKTSPKEYFDRINIPVLNMGGWYDGFLRGTVRCFTGMDESSDDEISKYQQLLLGPWTHEPMPKPLAGQKHFGNKASGEAIDIQGIMLNWYDHWLQGHTYNDSHRVKYYTMLENEWKTSYNWPPENTSKLTFYLHSNGDANQSMEGKLNSLIPESENPDQYIYDPQDPVITIGGAHLGGVPGHFETGVHGQAEVEKRKDVLIYTTEVLENHLEVSGNVKVNLFASSTAEDTDWTARLCYVDQTGKSWNISDGILRASFAGGLDKKRFINPNEIYQYCIDLGPISIKLNPGMKLRLQISSSNFPAYATNTNLKNNKYPTTDFVSANQIIYHDSDHPSKLVFDGIV